MYICLRKLFTIQELLERGVQLLSSDNEDHEFTGDMLLYKMSFDDITLQQKIDCIKRNLKTEQDKLKICKYKKYLRQYPITNCINKLERKLFGI